MSSFRRMHIDIREHLYETGLRVNEIQKAVCANNTHTHTPHTVIWDTFNWWIDSKPSLVRSRFVIANSMQIHLCHFKYASAYRLRWISVSAIVDDISSLAVRHLLVHRNVRETYWKGGGGGGWLVYQKLSVFCFHNQHNGRGELW